MVVAAFSEPNGGESQKIFQLVVDRLHDPEPMVRMAASHSLADRGNGSAIPYLEAAIAREQDESICSAFELNLKKLQMKAKN